MDDIELTTSLAADLDGAFEAFVRAHQDRCYSVALRVLGNSHDAEEVAQDAFVRAYRALGGYDAERIRGLQLRGWLATIVVNLARNRHRARRPAGITIDPEHAPPVADRAPGPDATAARREAADRWARLLGSLPDRYRIPIVLRHVDDLSYPEMAAVLDRPEGTIKAQVHRGIAMLRDAYVADEANDLDLPDDTREALRSHARVPASREASSQPPSRIRRTRAPSGPSDAPEPVSPSRRTLRIEVVR